MTTVLSTLGELILGKVKQPELGGLWEGEWVSKRKGDPAWAAVPRCLGPPSLLPRLALQHLLLPGTQAHEER